MFTPIRYVPVATARVTPMPLRTFIVFEALSPDQSSSGMECASSLRDPSIRAARKQSVAYARLWPIRDVQSHRYQFIDNRAQQGCDLTFTRLPLIDRHVVRAWPTGICGEKSRSRAVQEPD